MVKCSSILEVIIIILIIIIISIIIIIISIIIVVVVIISIFISIIVIRSCRYRYIPPQIMMWSYSIIRVTLCYGLIIITFVVVIVFAISHIYIDLIIFCYSPTLIDVFDLVARLNIR